MASYKPPVSPMSYGSKTNLHTRASRESSALLRFDMRLPARVKAELRSGKQGKAVREYIDKANIRPVLVKCGRHETLRQYFEAMDKDKSGSLEFKEVRRWLPKIGMDNPDFRNAVDNHFRFMDKDGSEEIDFKEFAQSTIDAADQKLSCYADEQYAKKFGIEIYMFLALCGRNKALKQFERDEAKAYDPGNELLPFFQFERLMKSSQAVFMPFELYAPEDDSLEGQRQSTKRPSSASRKSQSQHTASDVSKEAKSLIHELSYSLNERKERQNQVDRDEGEPGSGGSASDLVSGIGDTFDSSHVGYGSGDEGGGGSGGGGVVKAPSLEIPSRIMDNEEGEGEDGEKSVLNDNNDCLGEMISASSVGAGGTGGLNNNNNNLNGNEDVFGLNVQSRNITISGGLSNNSSSLIIPGTSDSDYKQLW
eukprot:CAMPEP_0114332770 /NCGR_PEP_ID=MMETSP0101-20121206/3312_1 /TAXON_ID=38822 ORGANISM="Pteridomonas danica, Strain PT" /NCGR_SAMPLE_ID=MMETSP0101 /ASSEMBLY_ACC=CAM_ASM_000211 /LENGTH=421 /DNA_ID=CAMNT_0001463571 /DNA_START=35 /DNA_END=1297 /DNA_ORIENTATION=-